MTQTSLMKVLPSFGGVWVGSLCRSSLYFLLFFVVWCGVLKPTNTALIAIRSFQDELGRAGFVWQFITLAGFHVDSLGITRFARAYAKDKMLAYVKEVQRKEREERVDTLTHQVTLTFTSLQPSSVDSDAGWFCVVVATTTAFRNGLALSCWTLPSTLSQAVWRPPLPCNTVLCCALLCCVLRLSHPTPRFVHCNDRQH
jgi:hypothetical protein